MNGICKEHGKSVIANGKWLRLESIQYTDAYGKDRSWECVSRQRCGGAVLMIAELVPSGRLILVRQYRPPAGKIVFEFPAGLIEPGESPLAAAVRELKEETGYEGKIVKVFPPAFNSPGLSGEFVVTVLMQVNEKEQQDQLQTDFDETEDIETVLVPKSGLPEAIEAEYRSGNGVDAKVLAYALSTAFSSSEDISRT